ncbi:MAG: hypothetical protein WDN28_23160 [Chthoniobacter sp.]
MRDANLTGRKLPLPSARLFNQTMMKSYLPHLLTILLSIGAVTVASADESLLDKPKARSLTAEEQSLFGPQSHGVHYDPRMIRAAQIARQRAIHA